MNEKTDAAAAVPAAPAMPEAPGFGHRIVELPGLRMHVATIGEGEPLLMLHGFPQHWWQWRVIGAGLADRYRVICPDLRGSGWTRAASPRIAHVSMRDDLIALMDAMSLDRVRIVAHDMGAIPAAHMAYDRPERVRAVVVMSVPPPFMRFTVGIVPAMRHVPNLWFHRPGGAPPDYLFAPPYVAKPMPADTMASYLAPLADPRIDAAIREIYRGLVGREVLLLATGAYRRRRLRVPALYVFGGQDAPLNAPFVRAHCGDTGRFADHLEIASVDGAAHHMTDDAPDAVEELVRDFFGRIGR